MPIIFDEVTASITPPSPATSGPAEPGGANSDAGIEPQTLQRELQRIAERSARLSAD